MTTVITPKVFNYTKIALKVIRYTLMAIVAVCAAYIVIFLNTRGVPQTFFGMAPNIKGEDTLVTRRYVRSGSVKRFDVVFYKIPRHEESNMYGRVVALPGETISAYKGLLYIDDKPLNESYPHSIDLKDMPPYTVPEDSFFVLLDDRTYRGQLGPDENPIAPDSREFGAIPVGNIIEKVIVKF